MLAGHTYKYETEATAKIFLPFVRFQFCYEDRIPEGEYVYTKLEPAGQQNRLTVSLNIREKTLSRDRLVDASLDVRKRSIFWRNCCTTLWWSLPASPPSGECPPAFAR